MGNSLQDQLLKAGIATEKQAVRARKARDTREKMRRKGQAVDDSAAEAVRAAEARRVDRDRSLNRRRAEKAERRARVAELRQLVEPNRVAQRGELEFRYLDGKKIRTLMLREEERGALIEGRLGIVKIEGRHDIVPRRVAERVAERDATALVLLNGSGDGKGASETAGDDYAGYEVPDDLIW